MPPTCLSKFLEHELFLVFRFDPLQRWVWGLAIGVPVAAALAYILFGPDTQVHQKIKSNIVFLNVLNLGSS